MGHVRRLCDFALAANYVRSANVIYFVLLPLLFSESIAMAGFKYTLGINELSSKKHKLTNALLAEFVGKRARAPFDWYHLHINMQFIHRNISIELFRVRSLHIRRSNNDVICLRFDGVRCSYGKYNQFYSILFSVEVLQSHCHFWIALKFTAFDTYCVRARLINGQMQLEHMSKTKWAFYLIVCQWLEALIWLIVGHTTKIDRARGSAGQAHFSTCSEQLQRSQLLKNDGSLLDMLAKHCLEK